MGRTHFSDGTIKNAFTIVERSGEKVIADVGGAVSGNVIGTYIHGIFDNDGFRQGFLDYIRKKKGLAMYKKGDKSSGINWDIEYNKLADVIRINSDMNKVYEILNCT